MDNFIKSSPTRTPVVVMETVECDLIVEEKEVMNARKLAILIKSRFCITGRDTGVQAGLHTGEQPVKEEEVWAWDVAGGQEHGQPGVQGDQGNGLEGEEQLEQVHG